MEDKIKAIEQQALDALKQIKSKQDLSDLRAKYLGRKSELSELFKNLVAASAAERPLLGQQINQVKTKLETLFMNKYQELENADRKKNLETSALDITLPATAPKRGTLHPVTIIMEEVKDIFKNLGYVVAEGPEIETDFYNFDGLNIPPNHPSRDMWSTLFIEDGRLLRTHTSPVQIHVMEKYKPPLAIIAPGRVYRRDSDLTHSPMFHQLEGFLVDKNITFGDLKGTLTHLLQQIFGKKRKVRFRPSYFPFTEPSAEVDVECFICQGKGCQVCKNTGWIEILGSGMIDPNVFEAVGYDSEKYSGFAFGMGIERIAMLKYGIDNIRLFFENDMRFLRQF